MGASDLRTVTAEARDAARNHRLRLAVIIPVFNNGELLRTRAFPSLVNSAYFAQMHILLIDDGSTYTATREAVAELAAAHPNVTAFFHAEGGSGSASRPRNTGVELAFTDYLTYLDPDDEMLDDGYWKLVEDLEAEPRAQFALGDEITDRNGQQRLLPNRPHYGKLADAEGLIRLSKNALRRTGFRPTSIEAMVVRTQWLKEQKLRQVEGAAGQDTLFFLQVLQAAEVCLLRDEPVYIYYADVAGSMVNAVGPGYFHKCLTLEKAQVKWLQQEGLLEDYLETRFEKFFVTWYLRQFSRVQPEHRQEVRSLLWEIACCYLSDPRAHRWQYPQSMWFFRKPGLPSLEGLRPWAAQAKLRGSAAAGQARQLTEGALTRAERLAARIRSGGDQPER
ncbi:glycosyltransferase family 2 protein [Nesterenkonia rhizosphaerae]|uniref:Glycosyltransferase 2-like domain-containing protein n=1 Tax=Nesterenkonia rhizosphaerae TaxID=1348272 RepID=A0ABP9GAR9_9MICC